MKNLIKIVMALVIFFIALSAYSITLTAPAGYVWDESGGSFAKGHPVSVSVVWDDYYRGTAWSATIGCDPDATTCWGIEDNGHVLEIPMITGSPGPGTDWFFLTTIIAP